MNGGAAVPDRGEPRAPKTESRAGHRAVVQSEIDDIEVLRGRVRRARTFMTVGALLMMPPLGIQVWQAARDGIGSLGGGALFGSVGFLLLAGMAVADYSGRRRQLERALEDRQSELIELGDGRD